MATEQGNTKVWIKIRVLNVRDIPYEYRKFHVADTE
jgi:hypothetical protein